MLKQVFQNPDEAVKGLCNLLQSLCMGSPVQRPSVKRRLIDMVSDSSDDEDDVPVSSNVSWNSESEDDGLSATPILSGDVPERSPSSKKKSKNRRKQKSISFNIIVNAFLLSSVYFV